MKVLFFVRLFYPHIGGVEKHVLEVGKLLVKDGHMVTVITENYGLKQEEIVEGIRVYRMTVGKENKLKKFRIWYWLWKHRRLMQEADIIHCHDVFFWYLPFRFLYPWKKVFTTFHGYEGYPIPKKAIVIRKISEKLSMGNICIGAFIAKWYGTKPTYIIEGGINKLQQHKLAKRRNKIKRLVLLGRLEVDTGVPIFIKMLSVLKKIGIPFSLEIIGEGSLKNQISKFGKTFGFVKDVYSHLEKADIILTSSHLSIMESLLIRKPIFATYSDPIKKDALFLAPFSQWINISNNPQKLAQKVKDNLKNNIDQLKLESGYAWAKQQTWKMVTNTYFNLWSVQ